MALRELYLDTSVWRIWDVHPADHDGAFGVRQIYLGGWLCIESGEEKRRYAPIPENWDELPDDALLELISQAEVAKRSAYDFNDRLSLRAAAAKRAAEEGGA
ncbi:MAG TPA: hypothetical protein VNP72_06285 [Longimicrobium sp.]|nr:hypothetical protein [Longimicrobium sp.]